MKWKCPVLHTYLHVKTPTRTSPQKQTYAVLTRDVGGDLSESCLAEAFGGARPN